MQQYLSTIPFYVYKVTFIPTGEFYFGSRYTHVKSKRLPEQDLWVKYFTSSKTIQAMVTTFGSDMFEPEFIEFGFDVEQIFWAEQDIIKAHIQDSKCLNGHYIEQVSRSAIFSNYGKTGWRNAAGEIKFQKSCPGEGWTVGSPSTGKKWWTKDGTYIMSHNSPGEGWTQNAPTRGKIWWTHNGEFVVSKNSPL
jgi:hypothetical protein